MFDTEAIYEDKMGMTITSGCVKIKKDNSNLIGISIGGGASFCPCLYIVQIFDNTPASKDGTLQSGDEITGINGISVKGKSKVEVAKMIQSAKDDVTVNYNKLHADPKQGRTLDIILKKVKHRLVENMSSSAADALGLSRAILCNDSLIKHLKELDQTEHMYQGIMERLKKVFRSMYQLMEIYQKLGDCFSMIGVREPHAAASEAFGQFGNLHRQMHKNGMQFLQSAKPIISGMMTYLTKAIPDTRLTIKKYADSKFEYLSYCLKVKEMDDEEYSYITLQEPLYRIETGNYEYRLILRCRQLARAQFAKFRTDVLVKLELLDNKHVQDIVFQLQQLISGLANYYEQCFYLLKNRQFFPIEVDLTYTALKGSVLSERFSEIEDCNINEEFTDLLGSFE